MDRPCRGTPWAARIRAFQVTHSTPQTPHATRSLDAFSWTGSGPFFRSRMPPKFGQTNPSPAAEMAGGVVVLEPLWERPAGTQTHSRRTGRKLGQVRCARQGLVRVPESNTKYGGKRGITGVGAAPVMGASIGESSGSPKRKKCCSPCGARLRPAVHRPAIYSVFFSSGGLHF